MKAFPFILDKGQRERAAHAIMGLSVNYPDSMEVQDHVALISSEDLNHHRLCHLSHAGMVRLATMVDGLAGCTN